MNENGATTAKVDSHDGKATNDPTAQPTEQQSAEVKTIPMDEHQRAMTGQYKAGITAAMKEVGFEPDKSDDFKE